jgi:ubiquitin-conjugating enzyme (huntingtin interacting protein 2)
MTSARDRRVLKELADMHADKEASGISVAPIAENDLTNLVGTVTAPSDTPYAGGTYQISVKIPERYPFQPPKMRFITNVWHPNVSSVTVGAWVSTLRHCLIAD